MSSCRILVFGCEDEWWHAYYGGNEDKFAISLWCWRFLGLTCIMPFLEAVHAFVKFAQAQDCFVCDFNTFVNMCCVELYMYFDPEKKYSHEHFKAFLDFHEGTHD